MSTQIKFNPKFSVEIADDVTIYKVFNNKLYVLLRRGAIVVTDPEVLAFIENDETIVKLLSGPCNTEEDYDNLTKMLQKIKGVSEVDIWKVYDISTIEGNKKREDLIELETFEVLRPFHSGKFYEKAIISEKGISYLGYETNLISESEPPKMGIADQESQFGPIKQLNHGFKPAETMVSINFICYDFEERNVKFLPEILTMGHPDVSVGSSNFLIKDLTGLSRGDGFVVDHLSGRCRKVVYPKNIDSSENENVGPKYNPVSNEIMRIQKEIDRVTNHLTKIDSIKFKEEVDDGDLNELIRHSVILYKEHLDKKYKNMTCRLDKVQKIGRKRRFKNMAICDNGLIHVVYDNGGGHTFSSEADNYIVLTKNISDMIDNDEIVVEWPRYSKTNLNMVGADHFSISKWFVASSKYYRFESEISFLEKTGKLYTFVNGKNTHVSIFDDSEKEIVPCEPDELYSYNNMLLYHTHNYYFDETVETVETVETKEDDKFRCNRKLFCYQSTDL